jgi:hypothetical protein
MPTRAIFRSFDHSSRLLNERQMAQISRIFRQDYGPYKTLYNRFIR